ncbi:MAG: hypothetical protein CSA26_09730 [Desulfobacterales bacterium]|nr:MAG: hypothetical protein CSA26_09730 [Desulfobacterales bacterium]
MNSEKIVYKKTICPLDCPDSCGLVARVAAGKVVSLRGDPDHPYTRGTICRKMSMYPRRLYSENRVLYPMRRVGKKGEGNFQRISWDEALALFAEKITTCVEQFGGDAILPYQYAGNMGVINRNGGYGLYNKLGTSVIKETICSAAAGAGWSMHLGDVPGSPPEVAEDARLIIAWGINVKVSNVHFWRYIAAAKKKGASLVVIDPYRNETAASADLYLQIVPGGDGALALGALKVLVEEEGIDREVLARETEGFAELEQYLEKTPWSAFSRLSGLAVGQIKSFARLLAEHPKTFIRIGIGLSRNSRGGMSVRSILALGAALGLFGGGEGRGILLSSRAFNGDKNLVRFPELAEKKERRVVNMAHLGHALTALTPPVKLFIVYNCNPASVAPDASVVRQGLLRADLFTVVHEQVLTPTAKYADLLLPATTFLENRDVYAAYGHFQLGVVDKVIEPVGEALSNFDLFQKLARELGYDDPPFCQSIDDRIASYLQSVDGLPAGFTLDDGGTVDWVTSTRKRKAVSVFTRWGVRFSFHGAAGAAIPVLLEPDESGNPDLLSRYPLHLITPPHRDLLNSTFGELYLKRPGDVLIHPADAEKYGITDGSRVRLRNFRGATVRVARITEDTAEGLLVAEGIFWQPDGEVGINALTSQKLTDIGEGPTFHESLVLLEPE